MPAIVFCYPGIDRISQSNAFSGEYGYKLVSLTTSFLEPPVSSEIIDYYDKLVIHTAQQGKTVLADFDFALMEYLYNLKKEEGLKTKVFPHNDIKLVAIYPNKSIGVEWREYATQLFEKDRIDKEDINRLRQFFDKDMRQIDYYNKTFDDFLDYQIIMNKDPIFYSIPSLLNSI